MKLPKTFVPENTDLDKKVQELSAEEYKPKPRMSLEERDLLEERLQEDYYSELMEKRKRWKTGDHLNRPGTDKISPKRLIFNISMMLLSMAGAAYLCKEISDYFPNYIMIPSVFGSMFGFPAATYRVIAEAMIRYDVRKKHEGKR